MVLKFGKYAANIKKIIDSFIRLNEINIIQEDMAIKISV